MNNTTLKPMSLAEVQAAACPVQELPPFDNGAPFYAKVRRANLMSLLTAGKIPNDLLGIAHQALDKGLTPTNFTPEQIPELGKLLDVICGACLVEPSWEEVKEYLTDEQVQAIMAYATAGAKALESFRRRPAEPAETGGDGEGVEPIPEQLLA